MDFSLIKRIYILNRQESTQSYVKLIFEKEKKLKLYFFIYCKWPSLFYFILFFGMIACIPNIIIKHIIYLFCFVQSSGLPTKRIIEKKEKNKYITLS